MEYESEFSLVWTSKSRKSILFYKYKLNKDRVVKTNNKLKIYQVSISRKSGNMFIYININNQWRRYREFYKNNKNARIIKKI